MYIIFKVLNNIEVYNSSAVARTGDIIYMYYVYCTSITIKYKMFHQLHNRVGKGIIIFITIVKHSNIVQDDKNDN